MEDSTANAKSIVACHGGDFCHRNNVAFAVRPSFCCLYPDILKYVVCGVARPFDAPRIGSYAVKVRGEIGRGVLFRSFLGGQSRFQGGPCFVRLCSAVRHGKVNV